MTDKKTILILRACGITGEKEECDNIKNQCELYGIEVHDRCPKSNEEIIKILNGEDAYYDYIYLSSHGSSEGFTSEDETVNFSWFDFGVKLCESSCMKEDCVIMLSCCRGGLNEVAYDLFYCCDYISFVVGPRQSLRPMDMLISFNILLYNIQHRNIDPIVACEKIKLATDIRFVCFDRMETVSDIGYQKHIERYTQDKIFFAEEAKEKALEQEITNSTNP